MESDLVHDPPPVGQQAFEHFRIRSSGHGDTSLKEGEFNINDQSSIVNAFFERDKAFFLDDLGRKGGANSEAQVGTRASPLRRLWHCLMPRAESQAACELCA
jgi:hypothetical protein